MTTATAPEFVVDFPALFVAVDWVPQHCVIPDLFRAGDPFDPSDWQAWCLLNAYRVKPTARVGQLATAFVNRRSQIVLPQKALALDTPVATLDGWSTMGELRIGDVVFDRNGEPTRVVDKSPVFLDTAYRVSFSDRSSLVACGEHEWLVDRRTSSGTYVAERTSTGSLLVAGLTDSHGARRFRVANAAPLRTTDADLPVPPYTLGAWLGDGESSGTRVTGIDRGVFDEIAGDGFEVVQTEHKRWNVRGLGSGLVRAGVLNRKHIPSLYLRASEQQRWALLQGLMDTDGFADLRAGKCEFTTVLPALRDGVRELLHSLGIKHRCYAGIARLNGRATGPKWRLAFSARSDMPVFRLARKQQRLLAPGRAHAQFGHRRITAIEPVGRVPTQCITVASPTRSFLAGREMIPTGNSGKAPYTACRICVEGVGPALFDGWARGGEVWDCRDHGCDCGWVYEYEPGEAMARPWATPLIQVTAYSEDQSGNIYDALRPMIEKGPLAELIPKTGEEFTRLPNGGRIDTVTSNAQSRLGARVTYVPQDETGIWTKSNGMIRVAETQRRGLAGMGGRAEETTNGWDPNEGSVAQRTAAAAARDIFRFHPQAPETLSYRDRRDRRKIHRYVYRGSPWVDLDGIEAEAAELLENDPAQAERFYGNRIVAGSDKAFDLDVYKSLYAPKAIPRGRKVVLSFDGALKFDATGLVVTDIESRHQAVVAWWLRPPGLPRDEDWQVPIDELNEAVAFAFATWDVWQFRGDPPHYRDDMNRWAGEYGEDRIVEFWTSLRKKMAYACRDFKTDMRPGVMSHGPLILEEGERPSERAIADHAALVEHVGNAVKVPTNFRESDGTFLWLIEKPSADSNQKIDLCMCGVIGWVGRGDAEKLGVLNEEAEATYERAQW